MINKLQEYIKWAREQMFKTNPPKEQHMDHMNNLPAGTQVTVTLPVKPKRVVVRKKKDVNNT
jgi:hypothetical protein